MAYLGYFPFGLPMLEYKGRLAHEHHAGEQRGAGGEVDGAERVSEQQGGEEDGDRGAREDDAQGVGDSHQRHAGQGRHEADAAQQAWYQYSTVLQYITLAYMPWTMMNSFWLQHPGSRDSAL